MSDKIKEINIKTPGQILDYVDTKEHLLELFNYITNLQEENQRLKELCDKYEEEHNTAFKLWTMKMEEMPTYEEKIEIQKENEHLRTELNTYKNAVYKIRNYINAYSPYFLQTQEENNQTIAKIIHEELDGGYEE